MTNYRRLRIAAFWAALAFAYACAIWPEDSAPSMTPSDKADHTITFISLSWLIRLAYPRSPWPLSGVALFGFGVFIELSQWLPFIGRDASVADVVADTIAIAIGLATALLAKRLLPRFFAR
jgi:VanZ family protein